MIHCRPRVCGATLGKPPWGMHYYEQLRTWYKEADDPIMMLKAVDKSEPKDEQAASALTQLKHGAHPVAFLAWFGRDTLPSRRNTVALIILIC